MKHGFLSWKRAKNACYGLPYVVPLRARQIVAHVIGDHGVKTCRKLWKLIPDEYKACCSYGDFWDAYEKVFPKETHQSVGKETGLTNHMERWSNTLRQSNTQYVRKALSFSKNDFYYKLVTRLMLFVTTYHLLLNHCLFFFWKMRCWYVRDWSRRRMVLKAGSHPALINHGLLHHFRA